MESRLFSLFLRGGLAAACLSIASGQAMAADDDASGELNSQPQVIEPDVARREIRRSKIDTEDFEVGGYFGIMSVEDFGSNSVYGFTFAYHINEMFFVEGGYGVSDTDETSFEILVPGTPLLSDDERELTYYDVSLGWNILPGEAFLTSNRAFNNSFYLIGGVGSTDFAGDDRFTVNFGFGGRIFATDWLALRLDVRDYLFDMDLFGEGKTTHNLQARMAITIFF